MSTTSSKDVSQEQILYDYQDVFTGPGKLPSVYKNEMDPNLKQDELKHNIKKHEYGCPSQGYTANSLDQHGCSRKANQAQSVPGTTAHNVLELAKICSTTTFFNSHV